MKNVNLPAVSATHMVHDSWYTRACSFVDCDITLAGSLYQIFRLWVSLFEDSTELSGLPLTYLTPLSRSTKRIPGPELLVIPTIGISGNLAETLRREKIMSAEDFAYARSFCLAKLLALCIKGGRRGVRL